ncbi:MAG TPA: FG-GAP-like repeat-containing protein [Solirubrobacterales bacterium]|nr:FG-GAP-like repeat-containing protein [Solirubrobacterales bacterium]
MLARLSVVRNLSRRPKSLLIAVAALVAAGLCVIAPAASGGFLAPAQYSVGFSAQGTAIGDLNGDDFPDLAVANAANNTVSVLINNGDGTFAAKVDYPAGSQPYSIEMGDLDSDGFPDLVVPNYGGDDLSVLMNEDDGTFAAAANFATGDMPTSVAIGQFNGDSFRDLAVTNRGDDDISVLLGGGNGSFAPKTDYAAGDTPNDIAAGDLNGDGRADLAVTLQGNEKTAIFLANLATGTFNPAVQYFSGAIPTGVALGDLNGNGTLDLVVTDTNSGGVAVQTGAGDGTFGAPTAFGVGTNPYTAAVGDLTGDGILDIATANNGSDTVSVLRGFGNSTFASSVNYPAGDGPWALAIGDLDGDENPDIAVSDWAEPKVSVLINDAPTATASPAPLTFPAQPTGTTGEQTLTITNTAGGGELLTGGTVLEGPDAADFSIGLNTCSEVPIPLAESCEITIGFTPSAVGSRNATLAVFYNSADGPLEVPLSGTGADVTPPDTVIDSGPSGTITTDSATFTFSGSPAGDTAKIMCKLDTAAFADCTSPKTFSNLADGSHTVAFRAEDAAGNQDPTPATRTFTVAPAKAKIGKVKFTGPKKVKKGSKAAYRVKITNTGKAGATGVKVKASGRGVSARASAGSIPAGRAKTIKLRIKPKKTGKIKVTLKVTSANAGTKTVKKTVTVKK